MDNTQLLRALNELDEYMQHKRAEAVQSLAQYQQAVKRIKTLIDGIDQSIAANNVSRKIVALHSAELPPAQPTKGN